MLESLDNDSLIGILKTTYFSKIVNTSIQSLVDKELLTSNDPPIDFVELDETIAFLKNAVSERLTSETAENALNEVHVRIDNQIKQDEDEKK